mmetsp:Transcript_31465/g.99784  ORF Transcript_31465/g.99784 Transcript_31465/m.99784 type:complete len:302 (-) Transcript_31465:617-1522(-)
MTLSKDFGTISKLASCSTPGSCSASPRPSSCATRRPTAGILARPASVQSRIMSVSRSLLSLCSLSSALLPPAVLRAPLRICISMSFSCSRPSSISLRTSSGASTQVMMRILPGMFSASTCALSRRTMMVSRSSAASSASLEAPRVSHPKVPWCASQYRVMNSFMAARGKSVSAAMACSCGQSSAGRESAGVPVSSSSRRAARMSGSAACVRFASRLLRKCDSSAMMAPNIFGFRRFWLVSFSIMDQLRMTTGESSMGSASFVTTRTSSSASTHSGRNFMSSFFQLARTPAGVSTSSGQSAR